MDFGADTIGGGVEGDDTGAGAFAYGAGAETGAGRGGRAGGADTGAAGAGFG